VTWVNWKLVWVHLEIVLILAQDRCTVCVERIIGSEIILDTRRYSFVTWVKWKLGWVCLEKVLISAQDRCTVLRRMYHVYGNLFGRTQ
jgi:hypothetical protein